ncbi:MAG TPA: hypothetical protein VK184_11730 [Nostocaceae cyanobacterium]|nr:hypothetical protein [Nostocaceae cyanobacterium]
MYEKTTPENLTRCVAYYNKLGDDYLVDIIKLPKIPLEELRKLWDQPENEPMIDCFPINTPERIDFFEKILGQKLEIEKYTYFLETI